MSFQNFCQEFAQTMVNNVFSPTARNIKDQLNNPTTLLSGIENWKNMVASKRPWDYKKSIRLEHGEWMTDNYTRTNFGYDIWGNVHYGFVGRFVGFKKATLTDGCWYSSSTRQ